MSDLAICMQASTYATPGHSRSSTPGPSPSGAYPVRDNSRGPTPPPRQTHAAEALGPRAGGGNALEPGQEQQLHKVLC